MTTHSVTQSNSSWWTAFDFRTTLIIQLQCYETSKTKDSNDKEKFSCDWLLQNASTADRKQIDQTNWSTLFAGLITATCLVRTNLISVWCLHSWLKAWPSAMVQGICDIHQWPVVKTRTPRCTRYKWALLGLAKEDHNLTCDHDREAYCTMWGSVKFLPCVSNLICYVTSLIHHNHITTKSLQNQYHIPTK